MTKTVTDTSESLPAAMPAFARMMRETRFAKGEEALIECGETQGAPTAKSERSVIGVS